MTFGHVTERSGNRELRVGQGRQYLMSDQRRKILVRLRVDCRSGEPPAFRENLLQQFFVAEQRFGQMLDALFIVGPSIREAGRGRRVRRRACRSRLQARSQGRRARSNGGTGRGHLQILPWFVEEAT